MTHLPHLHVELLTPVISAVNVHFIEHMSYFAVKLFPTNELTWKHFFLPDRETVDTTDGGWRIVVP